MEITNKYKIGDYVKYRYRNQSGVISEDIGIVDAYYLNDKYCTKEKLFISYMMKNHNELDERVSESDIVCKLVEDV